ncbi:MAG: exodeoxyribonuclease VII large subunit [Anaerolineales bacterium]
MLSFKWLTAFLNRGILAAVIPTENILTISELTRHLSALLQADPLLQNVWVRGEISNFSRPASGHLYFTLKDKTAALRCVMWRNQAARLQFVPRDGMSLEAHGSIGIYEPGGNYQLYVDVLRRLGEGALFVEFLRLKAWLESEGLFDVARKRQPPQMPRRLAIVTSGTGAALRDMLNTLARRWTLAQIFVCTTPVQGTEAPPGIVAALQRAAALQPDVILLARGGGSIEDLWAFNDESVVRAIAASPAPVITGIGHETDFTLADFAADLRAPTPTAAAELATPNREDLRLEVENLHTRLTAAQTRNLQTQRRAVRDLRTRLLARSPKNEVRRARQRVDEQAQRARQAAAQALNLRRLHVQALAQRLHALNPQQILGRGYALVFDARGELVSRVAQVNPGDALQIQVSDGTLGALATPSPRAEFHGEQENL